MAILITVLNNTVNYDPSTNKYFKHRFAEVGVGYYTSLNKKIKFQVFAGYGRGQGRVRVYGMYPFIDTDSIKKNATFTYERYFISPSFSFKRDGFIISITPRMTFVNITKCKVNNVHHSYSDACDIFIEPSATFQYTFVKSKSSFLSRLTLCGQAGINIVPMGFKYDVEEFNREYDFSRLTLAAGIGFRFDGIKLKKN